MRDRWYQREPESSLRGRSVWRPTGAAKPPKSEVQFVAVSTGGSGDIFVPVPTRTCCEHITYSGVCFICKKAVS